MYGCLKQLIQLLEAIFLRTAKYLLWTNKHKGLKNSSCYQFECCYKNVKISYEAVSSRKFDTGDEEIFFQIFDLILRNFTLFF